MNTNSPYFLKLRSAFFMLQPLVLWSVAIHDSIFIVAPTVSTFCLKMPIYHLISTKNLEEFRSSKHFGMVIKLVFDDARHNYCLQISQKQFSVIVPMLQ